MLLRFKLVLGVVTHDDPKICTVFCLAFGAGTWTFLIFFCRQFTLKPDQSINEIRESIENSVRSNHFRTVSEQRTRNESQRPREKWLVPFLAWPKPKIPFLGLFLLRNHMETLATQVRLKRAVFFVCYYRTS